MRQATILDVNPDPSALAWEQDFITRLEDHVVGCRGPRGEGRCPILNGRHCSKIEEADGVLFQLDLDRDDHRSILTLYKETLDVPIRVVCTLDQEERWHELLADVEVVAPPIGPSALDAFAAEVESSIDG